MKAPRRGRASPYMGYVGCVAPNRMVSLTVSVRDRVSSLVILFSNRVWFLQYCLEFGEEEEEAIRFHHRPYS